MAAHRNVLDRVKSETMSTRFFEDPSTPVAAKSTLQIVEQSLNLIITYKNSCETSGWEWSTTPFQLGICRDADSTHYRQTWDSRMMLRKEWISSEARWTNLPFSLSTSVAHFLPSPWICRIQLLVFTSISLRRWGHIAHPEDRLGVGLCIIIHTSKVIEVLRLLSAPIACDWLDSRAELAHFMGEYFSPRPGKLNLRLTSAQTILETT